jgi:general secretion pathway protein K
MVIVTLVATLAAAMVWQQWRAVQVEAAERARLQAAWILTGALDWARLILREDARTGGTNGTDNLGEPWAVPLAEARLSTFLAADKDNTDDAPDAFLSGAITDAQARYNLRNLFDAAGKVVPGELKVFQRLCDTAGVSPEAATRLANALASASLGGSDAPLMPQSVSQLTWLGIDAQTVALLAPYVVLLPTATPVNLNTATSDVIAAVLGLSAGDAKGLVAVRDRTPFKTLDEAKKSLPEGTVLTEQQVAVATRYFEVRGQLRMNERVLRERSLVVRSNQDVLTVQRERMSLTDPGS